MAKALKSKHKQPQVVVSKTPSKVQIPAQKVPNKSAQNRVDESFSGYSIQSLLCIEEENMFQEYEGLEQKYQTEASKQKTISRMQTCTNIGPIADEPIKKLTRHRSTRSCAQLPTIQSLQLGPPKQTKTSALKEFMSNKRSRSIVKMLDKLSSSGDNDSKPTGKVRHLRNQTWTDMRPFFTKNTLTN